MSDTVVEIRDKQGSTFRMKLSRPGSWFIPLRWAKDAKRTLTKGGWFGGSVAGEWSVQQEGFLTIRSGKTRSRFTENGDLTTSDLLILGPKGVKTYDGDDLFGMELFQFEDILGVNSDGEGIVIQPWVMALTPGRISWKRV